MQSITAVDNGETNLAGILPNEPWLERSFGEGVSALTGQPCVSAVEPFTVQPSRSFDTNYRYAMISSETAFEQEFSTEVSASYNMSYSASASASFLSNVQYSSTSMTIVASCEIATSGYGEQSTRPTLSADALALAKESPQKFRELYGDYYVDNALFGGRLLVTYTCYASSSSSLLKFEASIEGGSTFMTASAAAAFKQAASANNVSINMEISLEGTTTPPSIPMDIEGIPKLLDWFLEADLDGSPLHILMKPRRARLVHFAQLLPTLPMKLPVDPQTFTRIQTLNYRVLGLASLINQLPDYYAKQKSPSGRRYGELIAELKTEFFAVAPALPTDTTGLIDRLYEEAETIFKVMEPAVALVAFYDNITGNPPTEDESGTRSAFFGYTTQTGVPVPVEHKSFTYYHDWILFEWSHHTFMWPAGGADPDQIVVGWEMVDLKGEHNGKWTRKSPPLIGKNSGQIYVAGEGTRAVNWGCNIYYVEKKNFPWLLNPLERKVEWPVQQGRF